MDKETARAIRRLKSRIIILGTWFREAGAAALTKTEAPEAVLPLVEAMKDKNEKVRLAAFHSVKTLQGPAVDRLCSLWEEKRDESLEKMIRECGYFAQSPERLKYMTYLMRDMEDQVLDADGEGVNILLSLVRDKDRRIGNNCLKILQKLRNQDGIDRLCSFWEETREAFLKKIILESDYVARQPQALFFKTMYLHGRRPDVLPDDDVLISCLLDPEEPIMERAVAHELTINGDKGIIRLWDIAMQYPDAGIAEAIYTSGKFPSEAAQRALFYFLAGDLNQYHDIDFDQSLLKAWYESGASVLKQSIARRIRQSGDARLLSVFRTGQGGRLKPLSLTEVDVQMDIMIQCGNFAGLFELLPFAVYNQAARIIKAVKEAGWWHPDPRMAQMQIRLESLLTREQKMRNPLSYAGAIYRDFRPMFLGNEQLPSEEKDVLEWLKDDRNFRRRSAALILLAEKGSSGLSQAANSACADTHWQVRMAAAASELIRPGTLSPVNKTVLAEDHVFWVQALLKLPGGGRLSELGPEGLEMIRQEIKYASPDQKPSEPDDFMTRIRGLLSRPEREYLMIIGEYFGTEGEFSEDLHVDAGLTDVEVIFED